MLILGFGRLSTIIFTRKFIHLRSTITEKEAIGTRIVQLGVVHMDCQDLKVWVKLGPCTSANRYPAPLPILQREREIWALVIDHPYPPCAGLQIAHMNEFAGLLEKVNSDKEIKDRLGS